MTIRNLSRLKFKEKLKKHSGIRILRTSKQFWNLILSNIIKMIENLECRKISR